jgi:hypothetical protein
MDKDIPMFESTIDPNDPRKSAKEVLANIRKGWDIEKVNFKVPYVKLQFKRCRLDQLIVDFTIHDNACIVAKCSKRWLGCSTE